MAREVGGRPGDAQYAIQSTDRQQAAFQIAFGQGQGAWVDLPTGPEFVAGYLAVGVPRCAGQACCGAFAGGPYTFGDLRGGLGAAAERDQFGTGDGFHGDPQVDAVHQGAGEPGPVAADRGGPAFAAAAGRAVPAARAGVGGQGQEEAGGQPHHAGGPRDDHMSGFQRLAQCVQDACAAFCRLVQKKYAVVSQRYGPGARQSAAAAYEGRHGRGVVRCAVGRACDEWLSRREGAGHRMDGGDLQRFLGRQGRQQPGEAFGEHRLAGSGRAFEEDVVASCGGHLQGTAGAVLACDIGEIG